MIKTAVRGHSAKGFEGYIAVWIDGAFAYYLDAQITRLSYADAMRDAENLRTDLIKNGGQDHEANTTAPNLQH